MVSVGPARPGKLVAGTAARQSHSTAATLTDSGDTLVTPLYTVETVETVYCTSITLLLVARDKLCLLINLNINLGSNQSPF